MARLLIQPVLTLPGDGPTIALDARGLGSDDVVRFLDETDLAARTIVIVDDPNITAVRNTTVCYEYAPTTAEVSAEDRVAWIARAYGVDRLEVVPKPVASALNECT